MKDAVIVGAGLAGLSAAWRLRSWDIEVLEASHRVGGRIRSEKRGQYWLNWGGHMFAGKGTATAELLTETGTASVKIPGALAGMSLNGKTIYSGLIPTYPLRFPMPLSSRLEVIFKGLKITKDLFRYKKAVATRDGEGADVRQQRIFDFENTQSFADYVGKLSEDAEAFFKPVVTRSSARIDQLSAGGGIGYFSLVWNIGEGLDRYIQGGPSTLTEGIAQSIRDRVSLDSYVQEVVQQKDHVVVRYSKDGVDHEVTARTAIITTPAPLTHKIAVNLPKDTRDALAQIQYGPMVSGAFLTNETTAKPWDNTYGCAAGKKSFIIALNSGNIVHGRQTIRQPGGSMMVFSTAELAQELFELDDEQIAQRYLSDLDDVFPGFSDNVVEAKIARWPYGSPYTHAGRAKLQPILTRPSGRIFLAGDYLGNQYTETAISSGFNAALEAASRLATQSQCAAKVRDQQITDLAPAAVP